METALLNENKLKGNILAADIGCSSARIALIRANNGSAERKTECVFAGGGSVTDAIYDRLLSMLDARNILLRGLGESRLTADKFRQNCNAVRTAAERLKCAMSFTGDGASVKANIEIEAPDSSIVKITADSRERGLFAVSRTYADELGSKIMDAVSRSGASENDIDYVVISGRAAAAPVVCDSIKRFFVGSECDIMEIMYDVTIRARGAAAHALFSATGRTDPVVKSLLFDIGTISSGMLGDSPQFNMLLKADAVFSGGKINFGYRTRVSAAELEDEWFTLKLYKRDKGREDALYLYSPGSPIHYFGSIFVKLPKGYSFNTDIIHFKISIDAYGKLDAEAAHEREATFAEKLKNTLKASGHNIRDGYFILDTIRDIRF